MGRYREVKQYAGMWVIKLIPSDIKDLNIKEGDLVDIEDAVFRKSVPQKLKSIIKSEDKKR